MNVLFQSEQPIKLGFDAVLAERGLSRSDLTEVVFLVKKQATDSDQDAVLDLRLGDGLEWESDVNSNSILATITLQKWANMQAGDAYLFGIGFKESTSTNFTECKTEDRSFRVMPDFIRA